MKKIYILLYLNLCLILGLNAQNVSDVNTSFNDNLVTVSYNLKGVNSEELYNVKLYSSLDNFQKPLLGVTGNVGDSVKVGNNLKIVWDVNSYDFSNGNFDGQVTFEVRAVFQYVPLCFLNKFDNSYKKGNKIKVQYKGLKSLEGAYFSIINSNKRDSVVYNEHPNSSGITELVLPAHMHSGHFFIRLVDKKGNTSVESKLFEIKKGSGLIVKVGIPAILVGAVTGYFVLNSGKNNTNSTTPTNNDLPGPPNPQ